MNASYFYCFSLVWAGYIVIDKELNNLFDFASLPAHWANCASLVVQIDTEDSELLSKIYAFL